MSLQHKLPKSLLRSEYGTRADQLDYGPTDWICFDPADVRVYLRAESDAAWQRLAAGYSVALSGGDVGYVYLGLHAPPPEAGFLRIEAGGELDRQTDVTRAGAINSRELERFFDRLTVSQQAMRRDVDEARILAESAAGDATLWPPDTGTGPFTKGDWNPLVLYRAGERVTDAGAIWFALVDNVGLQPSLSPQWERAVSLAASGPLDGPLQFAASTIAGPLAVLPTGSEPAAKPPGALWIDAAGRWCWYLNGTVTYVMNSHVPASWIAGAIVNSASSVRADHLSMSAAIPYDDTPPLIGEGTEITALDHATYAESHHVALDASVPVYVTADAFVILALFAGNACIAAAATRLTATGAQVLTLRAAHAPPTRDSVRYSLRAGTSAGTLYLNGTSGGRAFGGISAVRLALTERRQ